MNKNVKVDELLRVRIPIQVCRDLGIQTKDTLNLTVEDNQIILKPLCFNRHCDVCATDFLVDYVYCPYCGVRLVDTKEGNN